MSIRKQIEALTSKRNGHLDAMEALNALANGENPRALTDDEQKAWDKDQGEVRDIDGQLVRLVEYEKQLAGRAEIVPAPGAPHVETPKFKAYKAQAFTRFVMAMAVGKGNLYQSLEIAKRWDNETPEVGAVLRAAVAAGTTTDPTWAAPLVNYQLMIGEFIELLRPETILGRLTGYRSIPFNVKIPRQTGGATAGWVGEGLSKPVSKLAFDSITVPWAKIAVICVITQELARFSNPQAEQLVRDDLIAAIAAFIDTQLLDPTVTASAGLRPASITNGVVAIPSTGGTIGAVITDFTAAMIAMTNALQQVGKPVWIMSSVAAMYLATLRTAQDIFAFPGMQGAATNQAQQTTTGLSLFGIPVVISGYQTVTAGKSSVVLVDQSQLMVADDGQVMIDTSTEASLQMDSAPATPPTPLISLFQQNMLAIKAERFIYWAMRKAGAVQIITGFPGP
jgi:HK97 family phage major capsid protein